MGISAGMTLGRAREKCSDVVIVPYLFSEIVECSKKMYQIFFSYSNVVEYKSIDEAFLEFPAELKDGMSIVDIANSIRTEIYEQTKCPCSAGIAHSILMCRLATRKVKSNGGNGTFHLNVEQDAKGWQHAMDEMGIDSLPGVGWKLKEKFKTFGISKCGELRTHPTLSKQANLRREFGQKIGVNIHNFLNGIDDRPLQLMKDRKTVGAEIGWGVRFHRMDQLRKFVKDLSAEVERRMRRIDPRLRGRQIAVKVKLKHPEAPQEPHKFLGHGWCVNVSRTVSLGQATNDASAIDDAVMGVLTGQLNVDPKVVRALGIHLAKLNFDALRAAGVQESNIGKLFKKAVDRPQVGTSTDVAVLPDFSQIDAEVIQYLPIELQREIGRAYKGKLVVQGTGSREGSEAVIERLRTKFDAAVIVSQSGLESCNIMEGVDTCDQSLFEEECLDGIRNVLLKWFQQTPNESHAALLTMYLSDCVLSDRLEMTHKLMSYLQSVSEKQVQWEPIAHAVIPKIQRMIEQKCGYKMKI